VAAIVGHYRETVNLNIPRQGAGRRRQGSQLDDVMCKMKHKLYIRNPDVESYRLVYK
jgi:hypothetical protein